jgi:hypothetical protein
MRPSSWPAIGGLFLCVATAACGACAACGESDSPAAADASLRRPDAAVPSWLAEARVAVVGVGVENEDCRTAVCPHNENTDLVRFGGAIYVVHRTAMSQVLGPNSSLRISRSTDEGATWTLLAVLPAIDGRDLRDPHFYVPPGQPDTLMIKALTRLPVVSLRDTNVNTIAVATASTDGGATWSPLTRIGPPTWSFWRIRERDGVLYTAAYEDGDLRVKLFASTDGTTWTPGAMIYDAPKDTPLETELVIMPSGRMLALVRMDGTDDELLGTEGRLRTKVCWAMPPYDSFDCPQTLDGERLDGPAALLHGDRLFVVARRHLGNQKRCTLFEIGGDLEGGPLTIEQHGDLPSAGDTAYAGVVDLDADHALVTWYSSSTAHDEPWVRAIFQASDIWQGTLDFSKL